MVGRADGADPTRGGSHQGLGQCPILEGMELAQVQRLATDLMNEHGVADWGFGFDRARRRAGCTWFTKRRITVSATLMELYPREEVVETILHEIAHALTGPEAHHNATWRAAAVRIGARPDRCVPEDLPRVPAPWVGVCPRGHEVQRFRRPSAVASCAVCSRRFELAHLLTWRLDGVPTSPGGRYDVQLRRLRSAIAAAADNGRAEPAAS